MNALHRVNPAWWALIRLSARSFYAYRFQSLVWCFSIMIQLYLLRVVWVGVYGSRESVLGVSSQTLLVYLTISALHRFFFPTIIDYRIQERVTSGRVALDLVRPFSFLRQMIAMQVGSTAGVLPLLVVIVPLAMLVGSLDFPGVENFLLYMLSLALATVVNLLIWIHVGMLSFWFLNVNGIRVMLKVCSDFLAGALVPLWFMPGGLRFALELLPFQATTFLPASIYAGQLGRIETLKPLGIQVIWILILIPTSRLVWSRAQRRIVIQGG